VDSVNLVAVKENPLRKRRFPRVDVRADSNVTHLVHVDAHVYSLLLQVFPKTDLRYRNPDIFGWDFCRVKNQIPLKTPVSKAPPEFLPHFRQDL
jgi:hypothetical protein